MRRTLLVVVLTLAIAGFALAAPMDSGDGRQGHMGMMRGAPMGMGAAMAAWDGNVYILEGLSLKEFGPDLTEIKSTDLPDPTADMQRLIAAGVCPACGADMNEPAAAEPNADQNAQRVANMCAMCKQRMMTMTKLVADSQGVYVLRMGHLYVYDQNLNLKTDAQVISPAAMKPTAAQMGMMDNMMDTMNTAPAAHTQSCAAVSVMNGEPVPASAACTTCRPVQDLGTNGSILGSLSNPRYREIPEGEVGIGNHPCPIAAGPLQIHIHVNNAQEDPDWGATVTAYVYPASLPSLGRQVMLKELPTGRWAGETTLPGAGPWEMAVRVQRTGRADAVTYWSLVAGCPIE